MVAAAAAASTIHPCHRSRSRRNHRLCRRRHSPCHPLRCFCRLDLRHHGVDGRRDRSPAACTHVLQQHCIYRALQHVVLCVSTPFNTIVIGHVHSTAQHSTARHGTARHGTARHGTQRLQWLKLATLVLRKHDRRSGRLGQTWTIQQWVEGWSVCAMRPADSPFQP